MNENIQIENVKILAKIKFVLIAKMWNPLTIQLANGITSKHQQQTC
jgi:hypothetical protein